MSVPDVIRLSDQDNVAVAVHDIPAGSRIRLGSLELTAGEPIPLGHKVALHHIEIGEKILKFGVPVGSASAAIPAGSHVHMHNVRSDYLNNRDEHWE